MSIDDDLGMKASITEGDHALRYFTDRYSFTRLIAERLNDPPAKEILFFYGAGGNGKSLLLAYLRKHSCKKLTNEQWRQWQDFGDEQLAKALKDLRLTGHLPVPTTLLDFAPGAKRRDADPFYGLIRIREGLVTAVKEMRYTLAFPLHTYGCFLYLKKTNRLEEANGLFPSEEAALLKEFGDLLKPIPGPGFAVALLDTINKYSGGRLAHYQKRFRLDEAEVQRLQAMDANKELILELPRLLAQDLNVAMTKADAPERVVLFFDTHEAFYGRERNFTANFFQDGWLRRLLRGLDTETGIVVVVAGRDKPRWAEAGAYELNTQIPAEYVCLRSVEDFTEGDAEIFLRKAGVQDASLRESLIRYASGEVGRVHPLHLGLCADVVLEAAVRGIALMPGDFSAVQAFQEKSAFLIETLLKYVDEGLRNAIRALSACRAFDFKIYQLLGKKLSFATDRATFQRLVGFSFVRQLGNIADNRYRIHDLLRRLGDEETVGRAHKVLADYYQMAGKIESIYHFNQLDWVQGVDLWFDSIEEALELSQYDSCRALLDLRKEMIVKTPFKLGVVSYAGAKYFERLALYEIAQTEYKRAITEYDKVLYSESDSSVVLSNKGIALAGLAEVKAVLSEHEIAEELYVAAVAAYDAALEIDPSDIGALNNKGITLRCLADMQVRLSDYNAAQTSYNRSALAHDAALSLDSNNINGFNNKGSSLQCLANLQALLSEYEAAQEKYVEAIKNYDTALLLFPNNPSALTNKGLAYKYLADLQSSLSQQKLAKESYSESLATYDVVLTLAPNDIHALVNKGFALQDLADLQSLLLEHDTAEKTYFESIAIYDVVLEQAPDEIYARNNKGLALKGLADLYKSLSEHEMAREKYSEAISAYNEILERSPDDLYTISNKGLALHGLANLQTLLLDYETAQESYVESIAIYDTALDLAPDFIQALHNKGLVVADFANFKDIQFLPEEALENRRAALSIFSSLLVLSPNDIDTLEQYEELTQLLVDADD